MTNGDIVFRIFRKKVGKDHASGLVLEFATAFPPEEFEIIGVHPVNLTGGGGNINSNYIVVARELPDTPEAPTSLGATTGSGGGEVDLVWTAPTNDGGAPITDYRIEFATIASGVFSAFIHPASDSTSITVNGLVTGVSYSFRVFAINVKGTGPVSNTDTATAD